MGIQFGASLRSIVYAKDYVVALVHMATQIEYVDSNDNTSACNVRFLAKSRPSQSLIRHKINAIRSKLKGNIHDNTDKDLLCLELDTTKMKDENESLIEKLIKYCFDDEE